MHLFIDSMPSKKKQPKEQGMRGPTHLAWMPGAATSPPAIGRGSSVGRVAVRRTLGRLAPPPPAARLHHCPLQILSTMGSPRKRSRRRSTCQRSPSYMRKPSGAVNRMNQEKTRQEAVTRRSRLEGAKDEIFSGTNVELRSVSSGGCSDPSWGVQTRSSTCTLACACACVCV